MIGRSMRVPSHHPRLLTHPTHRLLRNRLPGTCACPSSPAQPWPRRDAALSQASTALIVSMPRRWRMAVNCDLRGVQDDVTAVAFLTRPTLGAPGRALFPGDGETQCSKNHSGGAPDGSSLRSQAVTRSAVYPSLSSDGHPPSISLHLLYLSSTTNVSTLVERPKSPFDPPSVPSQ